MPGRLNRCFLFSSSTLKTPWHIPEREAREGGWRYLSAVVSCVGHAHQALVRPAVEVRVLSTDDAIACVARLALTAVHGVTVVAQVVALGILVAVMCPIRAGVSWLAHLRVQHPQVITECWKAPRHHRVQIPPPPPEAGRGPIRRKGDSSVPLHSEYIQATGKGCLTLDCRACKTRHV